MNKLNPMKYKSFTWKNNPTQCSYSCERALIKHRYPELVGIELEDVNVDSAIITGTGEFFGPDAYNQWDALNRVFREPGIGEFYHPIFTDVTHASMKKLEASLEPCPDYVMYTFEFWQNIPVVWAVNTPVTAQSTELKLGSVGTPVMELQQKLVSSGFKLPNINGVYDIDTETGVRYYQFKNSLPITGVADTNTLSHMGITIQPTQVTQKQDKLNNDTIHIVKSGETLSKIGTRYGISWQTIAKDNNLKNPHLIYPGQKITIKR